MLKYLVRFWELERKQNRSTLPVVIPLVLYHGRTAWNISQSFAALFQGTTGLEAYIPDFRYELCDVSHLPDEEIQGWILLRVSLLIFKYIFHPDLRTRLPELLGLLRELISQQHSLDYLNPSCYLVLDREPRLVG